MSRSSGAISAETVQEAVQVSNIRNIAIIGTGLVGSGMASLFIANGYRVRMLGISDAECDRGLKQVKENLADLVAEGILPEAMPAKFLERLSFTQAYSDLEGTDFVLEAVFERLDVKQSVYRLLEPHIGPDVVIASVTSAIPPNSLAESMAHRQRLIVAHPWNPPHLIPNIEVVRSDYTDDVSVDTLVALFESVNRTVVVLRKSIEGFIGNRLQHSLYREAIHLIEAGVATPEEIDKVVLSSFGPRFSSVGVLEYFDSCNLDLHYDVQTRLFPTLCNDAAPQKLVMDYIQRGELGLKTGKGLFEWDDAHKADFRHRKSAPFFKYFVWKENEDEGSRH